MRMSNASLTRRNMYNHYRKAKQAKEKEHRIQEYTTQQNEQEIWNKLSPEQKRRELEKRKEEQDSENLTILFWVGIIILIFIVIKSI
jgi:Flp pilus assembly protein TadB